jgi:hypothetical protein
MSSALRQKDYSKISGLLLLVLFALYPQPVGGINLTGRCTNAVADWRSKGAGRNSYRRSIDSRFNETERNLIERALRIAVSRIQKKSNWERVRELYGYAWVTRGTLDSTGLCDEVDVMRNLLFHQLYWLSMPNGENDTSQPFPDIYIRMGYEPSREGYSGWVARAPYNTVNLYWDWRFGEWRLSDDSKFDITLNNYHLATGGIYSDPEYWAGTIAHEMGHNLGHQHPSPSDPNYSKYQINILDEVIQNDGHSLKGSRPTLLSLHSDEGH